MDEAPRPDDRTLAQDEAAARASRESSLEAEVKGHPEAPAIEGYALVERLGRGSFGEVWRAWQRRTRRWVALKVFRDRAGLDWELLRLELERLALLDTHRGVVALLDADLSSEPPYCALELEIGGSLEPFARRGALAGEERVALWLERVCEALAFVHAKGVIHCDLKPANILLDGAGNPRLADFGQARVAGDAVAALGTLFFMAPEQAAAAAGKALPPDVRWDVYAFGATAFALLSGEPPHARLSPRIVTEGSSWSERLIAYAEGLRSAGVPGAPTRDEDLAAIIGRCLEPEPSRRYGGIGAVLADLRARREGRAVAPLAHRRLYRARKFVLRNLLLVGISAAAVAALAAAGVRLYREREGLRRQLAVSYLAQSQLEFWKGNPLRAVVYGAHSNALEPSHLARASTLWYLSEIAAPELVYDSNGLTALSPDGRRLAIVDAALGPVVREVETARLAAGPLRVNGDVTALSFSADAKILAIGTRARETALFDAATGRLLLEDPFWQDAMVTALAFSPNGRWLAAGGADGAVAVREVSSGRVAGSGMKHGDRVDSALFSPDGRVLLTTSGREGLARLWKVPSGEPLASVRIAGALHAAAFSPDGRLIVTAGGDRAVRLWSAKTGAAVGKPMAHASHVVAVAFSPDGKRLLAGGWDREAKLWDAARQQPIGRPMRHAGDVLSVAFSPDGRLVATGSADTTAQVWDAATQAPYGLVLEHPTAVTGVSFLPDGASLFTQSVGGSARLWPLSAAPALTRTLAHGQGVWDAAFSPDGRLVATAGKDGKAKLWDAGTGKLLRVLAHDDKVPSLRFTPDGRKLVTGSWSGIVRAWDVASGKELAQARHGAKLRLVDLSADGSRVLSADGDGSVRVWDARTLAASASIRHPGGRLEDARLSPDGRLVATAGGGAAARLWDAATGKPVGEPMLHDDDATRAAFSPDGRWLLTGSADGAARLWSAVDGAPVRGIFLRHKLAVKALAFSPDGRRVLTGSADQRMRLWDLASGRQLVAPMAHAGEIKAVAFSPDGKTLLSAGVDHIARLWDAETGVSIRSLAHDEAILAAAFSPDGRRVLTASTDGVARVWDAPWLVDDVSPAELRRRSDRVTIKKIGARGELVDLTHDEWLSDFGLSR